VAIVKHAPSPAFRLGWLRLMALAWHGLWRELRSGALITMFLALAIAVAAVTAVGFFTDRVDAGMRAQAAEFLAADGRIESPDSLNALQQKARALGLTTAQTLAFPTVILSGERTLLVSLKAVGAGYPLRGSLTIRAATPPDSNQDIRHGPEEGHVWLAPRALALLGLKVGDSVQIGQKRLTITATLEREPDIGNFLAQAAPRAMINLADIPATGLVTPVSRVSHYLLLAVPNGMNTSKLATLAKELPAHLNMERPQNSQPAFKTAFDRAARFLGLAAMVAVLLAGAALMLAAQQYNRTQQDPAALMRAFGVQSRQILYLYTLRLIFLALLSAVPGIALGALAQFGLAALLGAILDFKLPPPTWAPVGFGIGIALVALLGFALPALIRLQDTPPLRVLNRQLAPPPPTAVLLFGAGLLALGMLVWLQARDALLTAYVTGGLIVSLSAFIGIVWLLLRALRQYPARGVARFGLARLARAPWTSAMQIAALTLGLTALLLLSVVRSDLVNTWQTQIPDDAPNFFAINIQPNQVPELTRFLRNHHIDDAGLFAMHRARWTARNGQDVDVDGFTGQAKRLAEREFNLSVMPLTLAPDNQIVAGKWQPSASDAGWSVEQGIAEKLHWQLGDHLTFLVNGAPITAAITSIRKVDWDSMRPNFFVLAAPGLLSRQSAQFITSFYLPSPNLEQQKELLHAFPTLTLFDLSQILSQVRTLILRASQAVQYVFLFTLLAGLVVLLSAFAAGEVERIRETAVLRVLGASHRQIMGSLWFEFILIGLLSGLLSAIAAGGLGALLALKLFDLPWAMDWRLPAYGVASGITLAVFFVPYLGRRILSPAPAVTLRGQ
jgi:putative ABC transport system permease protein